MKAHSLAQICIFSIFLFIFCPEIVFAEENKTNWWNQTWHYRIPVKINSGNFERHNAPVSLRLDFSQLLKNAGTASPLDINSIRLIEVSPDGSVLGEIESQFDKSLHFSDSRQIGNLFWIARGIIRPDTVRYYHVYFDSLENGPKPQTNYQTPLSVSINGGKISIKNDIYKIEIENGLINSLMSLNASGHNCFAGGFPGCQALSRSFWENPIEDSDGAYYFAANGPLRITLRTKRKTKRQSVFSNINESFTFYAFNPKIEFTQFFLTSEKIQQLELGQFRINTAGNTWQADCLCGDAIKSFIVNRAGGTWISDSGAASELCWVLSSLTNKRDSFAFLLDKDKLESVSPCKYMFYDASGESKIQYIPSRISGDIIRVQGTLIPMEYMESPKERIKSAISEIEKKKNKISRSVGEPECKGKIAELATYPDYPIFPEIYKIETPDGFVPGTTEKMTVSFINEYVVPVKGSFEITDSNSLKHSEEIALKPFEVKKIEHPLVFPSSGKNCKITVVLKNSEGTLLSKKEFALAKKDPVSIEFTDKRIIYKGDSIRSSALLKNNLGHSIGEKIQVKAELCYLGRPIKEKRKTLNLEQASTFEFFFDTAQLSSGRHELRISAESDNRVLGSVTKPIFYIKEKQSDFTDIRRWSLIGANAQPDNTFVSTVDQMKKYGLNSCRVTYGWLEKDALLAASSENTLYSELMNFNAINIFSSHLPAWFRLKYPEFHCLDANGNKLSLAMNGFCMEYKDFQKYYCRHIEDSLKVLEKNGYASAYIINGELCNRHINHHPDAIESYRKWLTEKYHKIDALNKQWNSAYTSFEAIIPPKKPSGEKTEWNDYVHFRINSLSSFLGKTYRSAKSVTDKPVATIGFTRGWGRWSTNWGSSFYFSRDYMDFAALDIYPGTKAADCYLHFPFYTDMARGIIRKPVIYPEINNACAEERGSKKDTPEQAKTFLWQAFIHGGSGIQWCNWNTTHMSLLENLAPSNALKEIKKQSQLLARLKTFLSQENFADAPIGLLYSGENLETANLFCNSCINEFVGAYMLLRELGYEFDIVPLCDRKIMEKYKFLIVPSIRVISDEDIEALAAFARNGSCIFVTAESGAYNMDMRSRIQPLEKFGIKIKGNKSAALPIRTALLPDLKFEKKSIFEFPETTEKDKVLAYAGDMPIIIKRNIQKGSIVYAGTHIFEEPELTKGLIFDQWDIPDNASLKNKSFMSHVFSELDFPDMIKVSTLDKKDARFESRIYRVKSSAMLMGFNIGTASSFRFLIPSCRADSVVYDLLEGKALKTDISDEGLAFKYSVKPMTGCAFLILPSNEKFDEFIVQTTLSEKGIEYQIVLKNLKAPVPVEIKVFNSDGEALTLSKNCLVEGMRKGLIKLGNYDRYGTWEIHFKLLLNNHEIVRVHKF